MQAAEDVLHFFALLEALALVTGEVTVVHGALAHLAFRLAAVYIPAVCLTPEAPHELKYVNELVVLV